MKYYFCPKLPSAVRDAWLSIVNFSRTRDRFCLAPSLFSSRYSLKVAVLYRETSRGRMNCDIVMFKIDPLSSRFFFFNLLTWCHISYSLKQLNRKCCCCFGCFRICRDIFQRNLAAFEKQSPRWRCCYWLLDKLKKPKCRYKDGSDTSRNLELSAKLRRG